MDHVTFFHMPRLAGRDRRSWIKVSRVISARRGVRIDGNHAGGHNEMSSILAEPIAPSYFFLVQMREEGGVACAVSANEYSCAHGAQINFGDLTPYLTYDGSHVYATYHSGPNIHPAA